MPAKIRPLLVRAGARYACFEDGLCCTDMHALGPVTRPEAIRVRLVKPDALIRSRELDATVLATQGGACVFRGEIPGRAAVGCTLHAQIGERNKPDSCRRFPYRLVATELGGRIATEHRCPCRTLGDRPRITADKAIEALSFRAAANSRSELRLSMDAKVEGRIALNRDENVRFAEYVSQEAKLVDRLCAGEDALAVLGAKAFPKLETATFVDVAHLLRSQLDGTACNDALAFFGDILWATVQNRTDSNQITLRQRQWAPAFDRAEARSPIARTETDVFNDWIADEIWGLDWLTRGSFAQARADLSTRLTIARTVSSELRRQLGLRPDRAAAEAVMMAELTGQSPLWASVVRSMQV